MTADSIAAPRRSFIFIATWLAVALLTLDLPLWAQETESEGAEKDEKQ